MNPAIYPNQKSVLPGLVTSGRAKPDRRLNDKLAIVRPMRLKSGSEPGDGSGGKTMCNACYEYCLAQGVWDCPRPH